ncbi:MAG: M43 family zinc metalloprotease, partial [Lewinella sp.]
MNILPLIFALLASGFIPPANSGTIPDPDVMSCFSASANAALYKQDSAFSRKTDALEMAWSKAAQRDRFREKSVNPPPYVFPIVFHIVHQNGAENIADVDVQRSVDFLNQALANTDYYDPTTGANTQIQVCLAQRTPDNLSTNGINRIVSPLTNLHTDDDLTMKNLIRWAPRDYVNVWVVRELSGLGVGGGLAGYAYYPSAHGGVRDGIVMEARWLSRGEASVGVLIHELGHYLGLRHTFDGGCNNDDCTRDGDRVCDTPPDQSTVAVPCSGNANSCDTDTDSGFATDQNDMHINYMDYGYFRCYSAFTPGQRDRMHFFLDGIRRSLLESKGCLTPCPGVVDASFTGGDVTVPVGTTINFVNTSTNGNTYRWLENNSLLGTTPDYNQTFNTPGTYRIKLIAYPADQTLCQVDSVEQIIEVVCPVVADFTFPPATYETGAVVTFTNTSTGGGSSSWSVNGVQVMTDPNFTFTFAAPGRYQVCLQESNSLCTEDRCRSLIVRAPPCDVTARFSYNSVGFAVGGTLFFSNNSTGGSISTWTVDGTPTGNENNLTQTFPDLGSFEVCLRESNGVCEREFCRVVVVPEEPCTGSGCPGTQGCTEGFAYFYGKPDENQTEEVTAVLPYGDRYYLSVSSGNQLWVVAIREDGSIIWQTEIFPDGGGGLITEMLIDDEGQLAAIGRTSLDSESGTYSFMVRVNTDDGNLLWARSYQSDFTLPKFNRVFNQRGTGNYTIIGYTENTNSTTNVFDRDGLFLTVNKADGSIPTNPLHFQNNGSLRFNSAAYDADIGHYYVLGNFDNGSNPGTLGSGTFLLVLDEVGTPIANRSYNISQVESTSPVGIVKEGDELVVAITAELSSPQSHNTYLLRTSLDGGVKITTRIPDLTGPPREMIANSQGYILLGDVLFSPITTPPFQTELIQLDRNGTVSWANTILNHFHASSKQFPATPQMINTHNNQILLAGIHLSFWEGAVLKLDATGEPVSACNEAVPGAVVSEETALRSNVLQFFAEPNEYNTTDFFSEPGNLAFNEESCLPNCPEPNADSCLAPYTLIYTEVDAVDMGGFTAVVSGNDVHYVGGRLNEKPYLGAMHPDGTIIWSREFRLLNNGGVITDLILDDEGMLAGTGKMVTANSQFAGFAFRINPADGTILWARHYNLQLGDSGLYLNNIFARGGEYVLTGGHTTANSGINRPALLSVNQADGAQPSPGILYAPSAIQGFEDAEINPVTGTIYAMGTAGTFGGRRRRIRVFAIDQNNQLDWVTDYQNAQNDFIGRDLLWGNNQITVVGTLTEAGGTGSHLVYFQTDTIGGLTFSQSVDASFSIIPQALAWRETDLLLMAYNEANTHSLITTLDQAGTFPNSQLFEDRATVDPSFEAFEYNGRDLVSVGINSPTGGPVLEVLTAEGRQAAACRADGTTLIQLSPREINLSANALQDIPPPTELMPFIGTTEASEARLFLAPSLSCPTDCNEPDPPLEEICNNQIDDDEDGLIDCDDPDVAD